MVVPRCMRLLAVVCAALLVALFPTAAQAASVTGHATWFDALDQPYGGCGLLQSVLDSQYFVALNVFNTPHGYGGFSRPLPAGDPRIGMWDNGHNCGRWVRMSVCDFCTGINDGAPNQPFCRNGSLPPSCQPHATSPTPGSATPRANVAARLRAPEKVAG